MKSSIGRRSFVVGLALLLVQPLKLPAQQLSDADDRWVVSWATAQELYRAPAGQPGAGGPPPGFGGPQQARPEGQGFRISRTFNNQTVRMIVRPTLGGETVRVRLSNAFGATPVGVGAASIARRADGSAIVAGTIRPLTFGGRTEVTLLPGAVVVSDPVELEVAAGQDLAVSLYLPGESGRPTSHATGLHTTYVSSSGDFSAAPEIAADTTTLSYYWLAAVDVEADDDAGAIVGFGDSITDGTASSPNANMSWPALLGERLATGAFAGRYGIANMGISGNRLLADGAGVSALARLDRDVLSQPGVEWMILLEGINDIGSLGRANSTSTITTEDILWAYRQIIDRAHAAGVKVAGATLTPFEGAGYYSERGEAVRSAVNEWIRTSGAFDAVIDFDAATRDPANPRRIRPEFDPGDHLHPNDAGYRAMAEAIDLAIFR